jgi:hypothetical protein
MPWRTRLQGRSSSSCGSRRRSRGRTLRRSSREFRTITDGGDAARYAWRYCLQYLSKAPVPPPPVASDEWLRAEIDRMREVEEEQLRVRVAEQESPVGLTEVDGARGTSP